jgi:uncharacterized iron-regulated protein
VTAPGPRRSAVGPFASLAVSLILVGCGGVRGAVNSASPEPAIDAVRLPSGEPLDLETLTALLAEAQVVYVGERHDAAADHAVEAAIVRLARPNLLGMEMFSRPVQPALDAYARGELDEVGLVEQTEWNERWGMPFELYADVVRASRDVGARILALNAPREWTRAIARSGIAELPLEIRSALPELDLTNDAHRAMVMDALAGHTSHGGVAMDPAALERFYLAQLVWDETMGESVARALDAEPAARLVVVAGRMHVQGGLGIPRCAARRRTLRSLVVLPLTGPELERERASPSGLADIAIRVP